VKVIVLGVFCGKKQQKIVCDRASYLILLEELNNAVGKKVFRFTPKILPTLLDFGFVSLLGASVVQACFFCL